MFLGIVLIICGVLIALYPPLLSMIVAVLLIMAGIFVSIMAHSYRKAERRFKDPFVDFFMKM
jgi:uncharacterized membrane protein HdeD (DUF308 family)